MIYDFKADLAGSCQELFSVFEGWGLARHAEIVLHIDTGHGIFFKPLDDWVKPVIKWALEPSRQAHKIINYILLTKGFLG